jgi:hypothetical protein
MRGISAAKNLIKRAHISWEARGRDTQKKIFLRGQTHL